MRNPLTPTPFQDWDLLAAWIEADWRSIDIHDYPHLAGYNEALFDVAEAMRSSRPEDRGGCLYLLLTRALGVARDETEVVG